MTLDEYTSKLQHGVLNADEMPAIVQEITSALKEDLTERDTYRATAQEQENTIKTLRETNYKLLLRDPGNTKDGGGDKPEFDPNDYKPGKERANAIAEHYGKKSRFEDKYTKEEKK